MQEKDLYEYAVIRVVPRVEREEFINVGLIVFCKRRRYIKMLYEINDARIKALFPELDADELLANLDSFERISRGARDGGPIAQMEIAERFRWLTAVRSSVIQTSRPHPGMCTDLELLTKKLFEKLVS
ncbi:hypothetical protein VF13_41780 [Nostoc linckia z16]|nr:hypothetical protein VF13_41780 [Nostoc linckia z16]